MAIVVRGAQLLLSRAIFRGDWARIDKWDRELLSINAPQPSYIHHKEKHLDLPSRHFIPIHTQGQQAFDAEIARLVRNEYLLQNIRERFDRTLEKGRKSSSCNES